MAMSLAFVRAIGDAIEDAGEREHHEDADDSAAADDELEKNEG